MYVKHWHVAETCLQLLRDMWHVVDLVSAVALVSFLRDFISLTIEPLTCTNRNEAMQLWGDA